MKKETEILHSLPIDPLTGSISVPIYQTATFVQEAPGVHAGFDYARSNNPTRQVLEEWIARQEGGARGLAFASGLAAIDAVVKLLQAGDEIVAVDDLYGGAYRLFHRVYAQLGIVIRQVDTSDLKAVQEALSPRTRLVWLESPTNPTLKISDIAAIADIAHANGSLLVVDNTFASPLLQQPISLGADIVVHSATKYLAGHSDLIAGLLVAKDPEIGDRLKFIQNASGGILGPFDSWLTLRGVETLSLRVEKQCNNAYLVARFLETRPEVDRVYYPGLTSHPNHEIALRQQRLGGGIVSFTLREDTIEAASALVSSTKYFKLAESLGGVKSLLCLPARMTHASVPADVRRAAGVQDSLIRLSLGIEHPTDLIEDLEQAFAAVRVPALSHS